jgi:hypothetical protein
MLNIFLEVIHIVTEKNWNFSVFSREWHSPENSSLSNRERLDKFIVYYIAFSSLYYVANA